MSKEVMLKRAFSQASANGAVRFVDKEADFAVIRNFMVQYAKKNDVAVSEEEIEKFIGQQMTNMKELTKDFTYQKKMMN